MMALKQTMMWCDLPDLPGLVLVGPLCELDEGLKNCVVKTHEKS